MNLGVCVSLELPATTRHGAIVARIAVPSGLALVAAMLPQFATAIGLATPAVMVVTEGLISRPSRILEDFLRRGNVVDLSCQDLESFVPMAYRFFISAQQGEYEHNLKLLAAFLTTELQSPSCTPGSFLDMAKRVEGLNVLSLRAIALIGMEAKRLEEMGRASTGGIAITVEVLSDRARSKAPLNSREAVDALADLAGRGFLYPRSVTTYGGSHQLFTVTFPLEKLLSRALEIAKAETGG